MVFIDHSDLCDGRLSLTDLDVSSGSNARDKTAMSDGYQPPSVSKEQMKKMETALLELEGVVELGKWKAGLMGSQIEVHFEQFPEVYVEDLDANCVWNIVQVTENVYRPVDRPYSLTAEVRRFPPE